MIIIYLFGIFVFIFCIYYHYTYTSYIELFYDDLTHFQRGIKAYLCVSLNLDHVDQHTIEFFENKLKKVIPNNDVFYFEKTHYNNKIKRISNLNIKQRYKDLTLNGYQEINNLDLIHKTYDSKQLISIVLNKKNKTITCCFNHGIMDGVGIIKLISKIIETKNKKTRKIPIFKFNIIILIYSFIKLILNYNRLKNIKHTPVLYNNSENSTIYSLNVDICDINNIKNLNNCSFNAAIQAYIFNYIKDYSKKYNIVTLIAGEKKKNYFNYFGSIPYSINFDKLNDSLANTIDLNFYKNDFLAPISLNKRIISLFKKKYSNNVDILFSGLPFSKNDLYLNNSLVNYHKVFIPYHLAPMYVFSCKMKDKIFFSIGVRDKNLNKFLEKYKWHIIN